MLRKHELLVAVGSTPYLASHLKVDRLTFAVEAPEVAVAGASAPYRWVGIARQDCSYEPEPATPRSVME